LPEVAKHPEEPKGDKEKERAEHCEHGLRIEAAIVLGKFRLGRDRRRSNVFAGNCAEEVLAFP